MPKNFEIRLKAILKSHALNNRGIVRRISEDTGLHRHTVRKLYRDDLSNVSLTVLMKLLDWLEKHCRASSAQELFSKLVVVQPAKLWQAMLESQVVKVYLGSYQQTDKSAPALEWIAKEDADAMRHFVELLSIGGHVGSRPSVHIEYLSSPSVRGAAPSMTGLRQSRRVFANIMDSLSDNSSILIGSQRINYAVEFLVAELFGCQPFETQHEPYAIPFYHVYREEARHHSLPSCLGGMNLPDGAEGEPGTYYRVLDGVREKWECIPWIRDKQDAGIVIVLRKTTYPGVLLAAFGFSGRATAALSRTVCEDAQSFWHPDNMVGDCHIGAYICQYEFSTTDNQNDMRTKDGHLKKIVQLDPPILKRRIQRSGGASCADR